jgi:hypothetical protein
MLSVIYDATLSITTLSKETLSLRYTGFSMLLCCVSFMMAHISYSYAERHYAECRYAECCRATYFNYFINCCDIGEKRSLTRRNCFVFVQTGAISFINEMR